MQTPLYANAEDISSRKPRKPCLCPKNRLQLLPEQLAEIGTAFIQQLSCSPLTSREIRILSAIYDQTVARKKREDDMNGTCLELLTGIRSDHANHAVRCMEALDIVITRKGTYGKWMSINFDFQYWGKSSPEKKTNDPTILVSARYKTPLPDDTAGTIAFCSHTPPIAITANTKPIDKPVKEAVTAVTTPPVTQEEATQRHDKPSNTPSDKHPLTLPAKPFNISYPSSFSNPLREKIATALKEISVQQQAQRLVDYFAICLQNGTIRKPIAYFTTLKNRLLNGQLDLSEATPSDHQTRSPEQKKANQELPTLKAEYQLAIADYQYVKKTVESVSHDENLSFDKAADSIGFTPIWKKAVKRVETITQQLNAYQQQHPPTPQKAPPKKAKRTACESPQHIGELLNSLALLPT
ncbi:MAG: hypothetical protein KAG20_10245 [Cocleimonas sp.]|nr:hypothetical protein [Cocleimonas sp.]